MNGCVCEGGGGGGSQAVVAFLLSFIWRGSFIFGQKSIHMTVTLYML